MTITETMDLLHTETFMMQLHLKHHSSSFTHTIILFYKNPSILRLSNYEIASGDNWMSFAPRWNIHCPVNNCMDS